MTSPPLMAWCIAFSARRMAPDAPWWLHGLNSDYQHVFAYQGLDTKIRDDLTLKQTLILNQVGSRLECAVVALDVAEFTRNLTQPGGRLVLLDIRPAFQPTPYLRGPMTCVEAVKSLLGIRAFWIITPRQLFRRLCADGARILYPIP